MRESSWITFKFPARIEEEEKEQQIRSIYPVHLGSPNRIDSTQYVHNCMSSDTRNFGNSMNDRVIRSNVCFDVNSTLFISLSIAVNMLNRVLDIVSEFDSHPINR